MLSVGKDAQSTWKSEKEMESSLDRTIIYLTDERRYGYLLQLGAFASRVEYVDEFGNIIDTYVENEDFEELEEPFTYEQE